MIQIVKGDIFSINNEIKSIAHCISRDCMMGMGIAEVIRDIFPNMKDYLINKHPMIGKTYVYSEDEHTVFNLITKNKYYDKPTMETMRNSLSSLKDEMIKHKVKDIMIPYLIGCGLDRLSKSEVLYELNKIFKEDDRFNVVIVKRV